MLMLFDLVLFISIVFFYLLLSFFLKVVFLQYAVKSRVNMFKKLFSKSRVKGEIIRDLGLGSLINAAYMQPKTTISYVLIILSMCATIFGIMLKEEDNV